MTLYGSLISLAGALGALVFLVKYPIPSIVGVFALGTFGFGTVASLSRNVIEKGKPGSTLVSSSTNVAFNLGIALAVWVTGRVIDAGYDYESGGWIGAALTTTGLIMAIVSNRWKLNDESKQVSVSSIESSEKTPEKKADVKIIQISPPKKRTSLCAIVMSWFRCCYNDSQGDQSRVILSMD